MALKQINVPNSSAVHESPAMGLSTQGIGKFFGDVEVLSDISVDIRPGEVMALLGENGAGKSTFSNIIAGVIAPSAGQMWWEGRPYTPTSPGDAIAAGIGLIHQELRLLPDLSIAENVFVGRLPMRNGIVDRKLMNELAEQQLIRLGLDIAPTTRMANLRVAAQQQVEVAKALTLNSRLLILDEPTATLGGSETDRLFEQIEKLKAEGVGFIYISHRLEEIERIADRVTVLRDGRCVATHETARTPLHLLVEEMVGRRVDRMFPKLPDPGDKEVLRVTSLTASDGSFKDISFSVRAGEIFGIAGIVGAGRTELVSSIYGARPIEHGRIELDGEVVKMSGPDEAVSHGLVFVPEDRKNQGLILDQTIADNLAFGNFDVFAKDSWALPKRINAFVSKAIARFGVKGRAEQNVGELSGGNQQKLIIAKWISRQPAAIILDEPTRGIDVGARAAIYDLIADLAKSGMAVILVSSDLEEVLGLTHRVMVLAAGRSQGILERADANKVSVIELATR